VCPGTLQAVDPKILLDQLNSTRLRVPASDTPYKCAGCTKCFSTKYALTQHQENQVCLARIERGAIHCVEKETECAMYSNIMAMQEKINEQQEQINEQQKQINEQLKTISTGNVILVQQQNNFINIRNFGDEDVSHITPELAHELLMECDAGIVKLFRLIYFNDDMSQNRNIRLESKKKNRIAVLENGKWGIMNRTVGMKKAYTHTRRHYQHNYFTDREYMLKIQAMRDSPLHAHIPQFIDAINDNKSKDSRTIQVKLNDVVYEDWEKRSNQSTLNTVMSKLT
jgi:hypothetical protein